MASAALCPDPNVVHGFRRAHILANPPGNFEIKELAQNPPKDPASSGQTSRLTLTDSSKKNEGFERGQPNVGITR